MKEPPRQRSPSSAHNTARAMGNTVVLGATCFAGLGPLVRTALTRLSATDISISRIRDYDLVTFRLDRRKLSALQSLCVVEDVFLQIGRTDRITRTSDIRKLCARLNQSVVLDSIAARNDFFAMRGHRPKKTPSYFCFVRQDRDHPVHRSQIAKGVISSIGSIFPRWRTNDPADLEFWVFWSNNVSLMFRLSDKTLKYRSKEPPKLRAALRPTIAAAMVQLANLDDNHTVLDPFCGTGTLLLECRSQFPKARLSGSDQSSEAVATAAKRLGGNASIRRAALDELTHAPGAFDRILTNLPWGKQVPIQDDVYSAGVAQMLDWVVDDGMVVLLTPRSDLLEPTLRRLRARWSTTRVLVQGIRASIYAVSKR